MYGSKTLGGKLETAIAEHQRCGEMFEESSSMRTTYLPYCSGSRD